MFQFHNVIINVSISIFLYYPIRSFWFKISANVPALGEVAKFGTDYLLLKIKFLAKCKREFTTKFAILPNACCAIVFLFILSFSFTFFFFILSVFFLCHNSAYDRRTTIIRIASKRNFFYK
jgi:hypothetical protein